MDEFLVRALLAGGVVAILAGPLGAFLIWRRMAYFGSAVSHSALLGVAIGLLAGIDITLGVIGFCIAMALLLIALEHRTALPGDTLIGLIAHVALAGGLVALSLVPNLRADLLGYLFGDVLAVSWNDFALIALVSLAVLATLAAIWRPLLSLTVHADLAAVEGVRARRIEVLYMILVAVTVAIGMRVVGILLIVSLLIVPAAAARPFAGTPEIMAALAALIGVLSVTGGLFLSLNTDAQAGPAIVLVSGALFLLSLLAPKRRAA